MLYKAGGLPWMDCLVVCLVWTTSSSSPRIMTWLTSKPRKIADLLTRWCEDEEPAGSLRFEGGVGICGDKISTHVMTIYDRELQAKAGKPAYRISGPTLL